ncbi:MAG: redox-regulated ATPase YchF [Chloroflexi bacterium]|nr:redox-regulated ATPase YchF [Chloroflexota bacterium]
MGLPGSGKTTVFNALAQARAAVGGYSAPSSEPNLAVVKVPDPRLDALAPLFEPKKFTPAEVQYVDVAGIVRGQGKDSAGALLAHLRNTDVLLLVVRAFGNAATRGSDPTPVEDFEAVAFELVLADLDVVGKRFERLQKEAQLARGTPAERQARELELELFARLHAALSAERPLREIGLTPAEERVLRGYGLLTAKPLLALLNVDEPGPAADALVDVVKAKAGPGTEVVNLAGKLEMELAELPSDEADEMMEGFGIVESGLARVIQISYRLARLISFFTVGPDECRAWTIHDGSAAVDAAGAIHSDLARGFIRAEVIHWDQLLDAKTYAEARRRGQLRSEGKAYIVQDGDVLNILFNV